MRADFPKNLLPNQLRGDGGGKGAAIASLSLWGTKIDKLIKLKQKVTNVCVFTCDLTNQVTHYYSPQDEKVDGKLEERVTRELKSHARLR